MENGPRCCGHSTEAGTATSALADRGKISPLPSALKQNKQKKNPNHTKPNNFSSVHTRECLVSATEQHSCCVSLSIKWHACPLPRKILVPNMNHAPWLPSSVYSSRTASMQPFERYYNYYEEISHLLCWQELGCAPEEMPAIPRETASCLSLSSAPSKWRDIIAGPPWGVTGRALV